MREIKFRAWDTEKKEMYKPIHEAYKGNLFELVVGFGGDLSANTMDGLQHESIWPNRFILMQYTGLKDKNGKEIYQKDIGITMGGMKGTIEWHNERAMWIFHDENNFNSPLYEYIPLMEVIGNIYENPELCECG